LRILRWRGPLVIVAVMTVSAACTGAATESSDGSSDGLIRPANAPSAARGGPTGPAGEPITIGGTLGLTGAFAAPAAAIHAAYELWAANVNANGGLLGRPVELVIYDDTSSPATAHSLYQRLIEQDQVDLLLAPYSTVIGDAVFPLVERNEMVLFNGSFVSVDMFQNSEWMVGSLTYQEPDYTRELFDMIDALPQPQQPQRIGIATARDPFTLRVRDGFDGQGGVRAFAQDRGMTVVYDGEYPAGAIDAAAIVEQAQARNVDLFIALTLADDGPLLARAAHSIGFKPRIYCACGVPVTSLPQWHDLGPAAEGIMSTAMAWPSGDLPALEALSQHARTELGYPELPVHMTAGYTIMQVLQAAVEGVGEIDQTALRDYVAGRTIDTVVGPLTYDEDRIPEYESLLVQYRDDHNEVIWPADRATSDPQIPMGG
jgi:branched-chain amino acid transport system substrate-binding protein